MKWPRCENKIFINCIKVRKFTYTIVRWNALTFEYYFNIINFVSNEIRFKRAALYDYKFKVSHVCKKSITTSQFQISLGQYSLKQHTRRTSFRCILKNYYLPVSTPLQLSRDVLNTLAIREVFPHPDTPWTING